METRHWNMMVFPSLGQWLPQVIDGWNRETKLERHSVAEIALKERKEADFRWKYYLWFKAEQSCVSNHPVPGRFSKDACDGRTETAELIHGCSLSSGSRLNLALVSNELEKSNICFLCGFFSFFSDTFDSYRTFDCPIHSSDSNTMLNLANYSHGLLSVYGTQRFCYSSWWLSLNCFTSATEMYKTKPRKICHLQK